MDYNSNNIDQSLISAYQDTIYRTFKPALEFKIGELNEALSVFLFDNNAFSWAFVSASNPFSIKISEFENRKRTAALKAVIDNSDLRYLSGEGRCIDGFWLEKSFFILDISKKDAVQLAQQFDQNAIVFGHFNRTPELIICT